MKLLVPPPLQALICAGLIWLCSFLFPILNFQFEGQNALAIILVVCGLLIDVLAIRLFSQAKTTISPLDPSKSEQLVTGGIYRRTRNPMYIGMVIFVSAFGIWIGNWSFVAILVLFVWYIIKFQIKPEEEALREKFGESYEKYCTEVRRWV
ncbi:MAG: methyltransferase family protein [Rhizobiaceae bacterium]